MKYHELQTATPKKAKRVGRGISAGQGKTAGRGTKGQKSRTGSSAKPGFAGGQNPLMQKLPKLPGFRSQRVAAQTVTTAQLEKLGAKTVDAKVLAEAGLVANPYNRIKVLKKGDLSTAIAVSVQHASKTAVEAIESAGGSFAKTAVLQRPVTNAKRAEAKE